MVTCGSKTTSLFYRKIGARRRRILNCGNPHIMTDTVPTTEFWIIVEYVSLTRFPHHKTTPGETVEHFLGKLNELAENCDFENKEETLIRDVFITNLINPGIQKELREQTLEPSQLLELAINMVLGIRN